MKLNDNSLLKDKCLVDGNWIAAEDNQVIAVTNPASGEIVGRVPSLTGGQIEGVISASEKAFMQWRNYTAAKRSTILRKWFDLIIAHADDLATIMTSEQGKPLKEARGEILYAASFVEWFAEEAKRTYGDTIPSPQANQRITVIRQPIGVTASITPWNFPAAMITRKVAPALAAGCTMIVRPASLTPLTALALGELAQRAGIPAGVLQIITGKSSTLGKILTDSAVVRKLSFTGSTEVGRTLMSECASTIKRISLELGGNAPFIVFNDADIDEAVKGAITCKYRNAGQTCVCANRILVQAEIYDAFTEKFKRAVQALKVGNGMDAGTDIGPFIEESAVKKVEGLIADALKKNGKLVLGGKRLGGLFFEPTIMTDITPEMRFASEETFGPVAPLFKFDTEEEAIGMANNTIFGLAAYFYTRDYARMVRVSEALEYGMIGHNTGLISNEVAPFGGIKQSGLGREGSKYGIEEYTELKYICSSTN